MQERPKEITHPRDGKVWANLTTEPLRPTECLCLNCANMQPGKPGHCKFAQAFYKTCVDGKIALMVTRCPVFVDKNAACDKVLEIIDPT